MHRSEHRRDRDFAGLALVRRVLPVDDMKALLIVIVALFATTDAYAENVDWSQYLETKSDRPLTSVGSSKPETVAKTSTTASKKKVAKVSKKKARKGKAKRARRR